MGGGGAQDRRYQVFISSTFLDLQPERQEVIQALLELDCFPAGMELFPAADDEKWELIKSVIDDSDFYVVIIGGRYGSTDDDGLSFTEKEYDYAVETKRPVLGFVHSEPDELPGKFLEKDPKLQKRLDAFRAKVSKRMCKMWKSPEELGSVVSRSLVKATKGTDAVGWIRADAAMTPEHLQEVAELRQRLAEYETERERIRTSAPPGTEVFAQGSDEVTIAYAYGHKPPGEFYDDTLYESADVSWDQVFGALGPALFDEASETLLRNRLNDMLTAVEFDALMDAHNDVGAISWIKSDQESFDRVKVQLVALRLIEKSDKKHGVHDSNAYWRLTPYGETYVMSLHAVRRDDQAKEANEGGDDADS